jgi:hypothetical protein
LRTILQATADVTAFLTSNGLDYRKIVKVFFSSWIDRVCLVRKAKYIWREKVSLLRLDDVLKTIAAARKIFLKLDVQGFKSQVLQGATRILSQPRRPVGDVASSSL